MIHRLFVKMALFDALFLMALALAAYLHLGHVWLLYVITIMAATAFFRVLADMSTWFDGLANNLNFIARCIRDHQ